MRFPLRGAHNICSFTSKGLKNLQESEQKSSSHHNTTPSCQHNLEPSCASPEGLTGT